MWIRNDAKTTPNRRIPYTVLHKHKNSQSKFREAMSYYTVNKKLRFVSRHQRQNDSVCDNQTKKTWKINTQRMTCEEKIELKQFIYNKPYKVY